MMSLPSKIPSVVKEGCRVELELISQTGELESLTVEIVPDQKADYDSGLLGVSTPLARAVLHQPAGRTIPYRMGDLKAVRIVSIAYGQEADDSAAARRREAAQKAAEEVDRTNAMVFASSFSGKWGDYDPKGIEAWEKKPDEQDEQDSPDPGDKDDT
jgi:hypothetical protein